MPFLRKQIITTGVGILWSDAPKSLYFPAENGRSLALSGSPVWVAHPSLCLYFTEKPKNSALIENLPEPIYVLGFALEEVFLTEHQHITRNQTQARPVQLHMEGLLQGIQRSTNRVLSSTSTKSQVNLVS